MDDGARPAVFTIPSHRSFADALATGLLQKIGRDPLLLAKGRILLPNGRAMRAVTEAFVRASGSGLVLPRLIVIGDPELEERVGGALDPAGLDDPVPPAIDPLVRQLALASIIRRPGETVAESMRLASDLARTLDALTIEDVSPSRLREFARDDPELAGHWQASLDRLSAILEAWPAELERRGAIDLTDRRNRLLKRMAAKWGSNPPEGFTVAAGITTAAPAIAALLRRVANMPGGWVILPGLALSDTLPDDEWDRLDETPSHPQHHLKHLLERIGVARAEVAVWSGRGRANSPAVRGRAVANAMTAADFSDKWVALPARERSLSGVKAIELPDPASEAMAIAIALRGALERDGETAALVTPDRALASRVSAQLKRWGIDADDSAGRPLAQEPAGTLLLNVAAAAAERLSPVSLLALLKHPLVGGEGADRQTWLRSVRELDRKLRGPRPGAGLAALDTHFAEGKASEEWRRVRGALEPCDFLAGAPLSLAEIASNIRHAATALAGARAWSGTDGRAAAELVAALEAADDARLLHPGDEDIVPMLQEIMGRTPVRPPYGGHPRVAIWGLLEARLQHADFLVLGGLNEGVWPTLPAPDPWLAPKVRVELGLPSLEHRIGLSAHDFASALGAPRVLLSRARRDTSSPTVASRLWLRLEAMTGGMPRDRVLEDWVRAIDEPEAVSPATRPAPNPPASERPREVWVTQLDRLKADPFAFYARTMLDLKALDPVDADRSAAWKGSAVHEVLEHWFKESDCDPDDLVARAEAMIAGEAIHPMLRALWQPRLIEAIKWIADQVAEERISGRVPAAVEEEGSTVIGGVTVRGRADRIDRMPDGGLGIVDYKTGKPPSAKAISEGFALQLGMLGLIARGGGFDAAKGEPTAHEYWSLAKDNEKYGKRVAPDKKDGADAFLEQTLRHFLGLAADYLTGDRPFEAKLHPAFAPYGDYDQLMRLEEWYGRS